ncbi:hypothetical protein FYA90_03980 [Bordetella holmesii]|nr:hypothetical protein FYA90_03980 [Bordetella holmesii]
MNKNIYRLVWSRARGLGWLLENGLVQWVRRAANAVACARVCVRPRRP